MTQKSSDNDTTTRRPTDGDPADMTDFEKNATTEEASASAHPRTVVVPQPLLDGFRRRHIAAFGRLV